MKFRDMLVPSTKWTAVCHDGAIALGMPWRHFYQLSMDNLHRAVTHLAEALSLTVRARVCRRLLALSVATGQAAITQDELAKLLGVTRPTLRRCLIELEALGAIETQYRKLRVIDASILKDLKDEQ